MDTGNRKDRGLTKVPEGTELANAKSRTKKMRGSKIRYCKYGTEDNKKGVGPESCRTRCVAQLCIEGTILFTIQTEAPGKRILQLPGLFTTQKIIIKNKDLNKSDYNGIQRNLGTLLNSAQQLEGKQVQIDPIKV